MERPSCCSFLHELMTDRDHTRAVHATSKSIVQSRRLLRRLGCDTLHSAVDVPSALCLRLVERERCNSRVPQLAEHAGLGTLVLDTLTTRRVCCVVGTALLGQEVVEETAGGLQRFVSVVCFACIVLEDKTYATTLAVSLIGGSVGSGVGGRRHDGRLR